MNAENLNMGEKHLANQETLSAENRREHKRFVMLEYAKIKLADEAESSSVLVDLSLGGLQLRSRHQYEAGSIVDVSIGRGDTEPIALKAEVRYSLPVKKSDLFATGLKFVTMDEASTHKWVDYVHNVFKDQGEDLLAD